MFFCLSGNIHPSQTSGSLPHSSGVEIVEKEEEEFERIYLKEKEGWVRIEDAEDDK